MHRRLPDVIEGASAMQSSLASRTVSNVIQVTLRWGGWGSNPRLADYEKYGPALPVRYLHMRQTPNRARISSRFIRCSAG